MEMVSKSSGKWEKRLTWTQMRSMRPSRRCSEEHTDAPKRRRRDLEMKLLLLKETSPQKTKRNSKNFWRQPPKISERRNSNAWAKPSEKASREEVCLKRRLMPLLESWPQEPKKASKSRKELST